MRIQTNCTSSVVNLPQGGIFVILLIVHLRSFRGSITPKNFCSRLRCSHFGLKTVLARMRQKNKPFMGLYDWHCSYRHFWSFSATIGFYQPLDVCEWTFTNGTELISWNTTRSMSKQAIHYSCAWYAANETSERASAAYYNSNMSKHELPGWICSHRTKSARLVVTCRAPWRVRVCVCARARSSVQTGIQRDAQKNIYSLWSCCTKIY